jgi:hypothetical protein
LSTGLLLGVLDFDDGRLLALSSGSEPLAYKSSALTIILVVIITAILVGKPEPL